MRAVFAGPVAAVFALGLAGCGSSDEPPEVTANSSGAQVQIGNTINYGSVGTAADLDCAQGKALNVGGSNNTLTVTGTCSSVNIGGADNKVTLDKVEGEISVVGLDNTVVYKDGNPKVEDLGKGNTVDKG